jgi:hypothetical protein
VSGQLVGDRPRHRIPDDRDGHALLGPNQGQDTTVLASRNAVNSVPPASAEA